MADGGLHLQLSGLQKQLEEAREFEPQAKSLQEKLQTVSKRSLEALTKAQNDKEQLQQRLQAEAAETVRLRQQQQAVLAAVQGTGGSRNGTMHAAGGSLAVPGRVVGASSGGEAGAWPPEQVQGQRQAAWALQQALPQLQEVAGLKPALEALVKQHAAGKSRLTCGVAILSLHLADIPYLAICLSQMYHASSTCSRAVFFRCVSLEDFNSAQVKRQPRLSS